MRSMHRGFPSLIHSLRESSTPQIRSRPVDRSETRSTHTHIHTHTHTPIETGIPQNDMLALYPVPRFGPASARVTGESGSGYPPTSASASRGSGRFSDRLVHLRTAGRQSGRRIKRRQLISRSTSHADHVTLLAWEGWLVM